MSKFRNGVKFEKLAKLNKSDLSSAYIHSLVKESSFSTTKKSLNLSRPYKESMLNIIEDGGKLSLEIAVGPFYFSGAYTYC